ncbi:HAD family hydrolase [Seonamhaeicola sp.]|uniref:HAD family hydrolase n=1 Tax=Seonamhaeicola sp. TaxID=1912245 RepID=UPI00262E6C00|nr:HAD family hydrolase [Seonamhaeicola sp.]
MKKTVLVVDLDGTLFSINTFHYFLKFLFLNGVKKFKLVFLLRFGFILFFRILKVSSHAKMKYVILKLISKREDIDFEKFVDSLAFKRNRIPVLDTFFDIKILATAAPICYADIIAKNEQFDVCFATQLPEMFSEDFENFREVKKKHVMSYLLSKGIREIDVLVTDHIDDLPLMKQSRKTIIVAPDSKLLDELKYNQIAFEILK